MQWLNANVRIVGIEKAKGFGWMTVKVAGDVAAVDAAVQTGHCYNKGNESICSS